MASLIKRNGIYSLQWYVGKKIRRRSLRTTWRGPKAEARNLRPRGMGQYVEAFGIPPQAALLRRRAAARIGRHRIRLRSGVRGTQRSGVVSGGVAVVVAQQAAEDWLAPDGLRIEVGIDGRRIG